MYGRDKSLGKVDLPPANLDAGEPQWFPLQGAKSGALLLNTEFLAPGDIPSIETSGSKPIKETYFTWIQCQVYQNKDLSIVHWTLLLMLWPDYEM